MSWAGAMVSTIGSIPEQDEMTFLHQLPCVGAEHILRGPPPSLVGRSLLAVHLKYAALQEESSFTPSFVLLLFPPLL